MSKVAILDVGYGNTDSIRLAFARLGAEPILTTDPTLAKDAERLVLPGVGSAGFAMSRLRELGLIDPIRSRSKPMLGICLGMQLMLDRSEEGEVDCLGLIKGQVRAMAPEPGLPVPHMGWTRLDEAHDGTGLKASDYVYFAHSYSCDDGPATAARATYGGYTVPAALRADHLWAAQFHPERSSAAGAAFLRAFLGS